MSTGHHNGRLPGGRPEADAPSLSPAGRHDRQTQEDMIMNDIDVDQPVRVTPELARAIARMLSALGSVPGTTAEEVTRELGKPLADGRNVIGMFARRVDPGRTGGRRARP
jgi:hypothetical protein